MSQCSRCNFIFCIACQSECPYYLGKMTMCVPCSIDFHSNHTSVHNDAILYADGKCKHCHVCNNIICEKCGITCCNIKHNTSELDECMYCEPCFRSNHTCRLCKTSIPLGQCNTCKLCSIHREYRRTCASCITTECNMCGVICTECFNGYHYVCSTCTRIARHPPDYTVCNASIVHDIHMNTICTVCKDAKLCTSNYFRCSNIDCCQIQSYYICESCDKSSINHRCDGCNSDMVDYTVALDHAM